MACMHKLLTIRNAIARTKSPWSRRLRVLLELVIQGGCWRAWRFSAPQVRDCNTRPRSCPLDLDGDMQFGRWGAPADAGIERPAA